MTPEPIVTKPDEVESFNPPHHDKIESVELVNPEKGSDNITFRISTGEPGADDHWHAHDNSDQIVFILRGKKRMFIGEPGDPDMENAEEHIITPGTFVFLPENTYHQSESIGDEPCEEIVIWAPPYQSLDEWDPENN